MKKVEAMTRSTSIQRSRSHRLPELRPGDEQGEGDHQPDARRHHRDLDHLDVHTYDREQRVDERSGLECAGIAGPQLERPVAPELCPEQQQHAVLQEERHAECGDQHRETGRGSQRAVGEALDDDSESAGSEHRRQEHEDDEREERE